MNVVIFLLKQIVSDWINITIYEDNMKLTGRDLDKMLHDDESENDADISTIGNNIQKMRTAAGKQRREEENEYSGQDAKRYHKKAHN